jgi:hypothetical protein
MTMCLSTSLLVSDFHEPVVGSCLVVGPLFNATGYFCTLYNPCHRAVYEGIISLRVPVPISEAQKSR